MTPARITINDIRAVGICVSGARKWFPANDLDFGAFLKDGIDTQVFLATGDPLARQVVDAAAKRAAATGNN